MKWFTKILTPASAGESEVAMGDTPTTATPPAVIGGITKDEVNKLIQDGIAAGLSKAVADAIKPIVDRQGEIEKNLDTVAKTVASQKILGEDQVKALVTAEAKSRDEKAAKDAEVKQATENLNGKRTTYASEHLKNVPSRYHADLGDDETKWADNAKSIRGVFAQDMKAAGVQVPNVGGDAGGDAVPGKPASGGAFLKMAGVAPPVATPAQK